MKDVKENWMANDTGVRATCVACMTHLKGSAIDKCVILSARDMHGHGPSSLIRNFQFFFIQLT